MIKNFNEFATEAEYKTFRFDLIKNIEGAENAANYDRVKKATIGVGFNIGIPGRVRDAVMEGFGFAQGSYSTRSANRAEKKYYRKITSLLDGSPVSGLAGRLDGIMLRRSNDSRYGRLEQAAMRTSFSYNSDAEMQAVFDTIIERFESKVDAWVADIPFGRERTVLVSLSYNGVLSKSPSLKSAIMNDS